VSLIRNFIKDLDRDWTSAAPAKIRLRIIGSTALMLQADYERGTKDSDVLETADLDGETRARLQRNAGPGSVLHARHKLYLEIVSSGLPLLAQAPKWRDVADLNWDLTHFQVEVLDVVDVVVSKLKRFHATDVRDIEAMIDRGLVDHAALIERFRSAVDCYGMDSRADDLPKYVANLHRSSAIYSVFLRPRSSCRVGSPSLDRSAPRTGRVLPCKATNVARSVGRTRIESMIRAEAILGGMGLARASADTTHRYWIQRPPWEENVLVRAPNDAPAAIEEVTRLPATGDAVGVTVDPTGPFVYWTDDEGRVGRVEKRGGGGELLSETGPYDDDDYRPFVAVRGDSVLWIGGEPGRRADDDHPAGLYELCK
jgi:hypothetical protein